MLLYVIFYPPSIVFSFYLISFLLFLFIQRSSCLLNSNLHLQWTLGGGERIVEAWRERKKLRGFELSFTNTEIAWLPSTNTKFNHNIWCCKYHISSWSRIFYTPTWRMRCWAHPFQCREATTHHNNKSHMVCHSASELKRPSSSKSRNQFLSLIIPPPTKKKEWEI
jgi:hypothetical protein